MENRQLDIAIIGKSMVGKSTFIAELIKDKLIADRLHEDNTQGMTKVYTKYKLSCEAGTVITIKCNPQLYWTTVVGGGCNELEEEMTIDFPFEEAKRRIKSLIQLDNKLSLVGEVSSQITIKNLYDKKVNIIKCIDKTKEQDDQFVERKSIFGCMTDKQIKELFFELVEAFNNKYSDITNIQAILDFVNEKPIAAIEYITIQVEAVDEMKDYLLKHNLNSVNLLDTRGFGDMELKLKGEQIERQERQPLPLVDACVYVVDSRNLTESEWTLLRPYVEEQLKSVPVLFCARDSQRIPKLFIDEWIKEKEIGIVAEYNKYAEDYLEDDHKEIVSRLNNIIKKDNSFITEYLNACKLIGLPNFKPGKSDPNRIVYTVQDNEFLETLYRLQVISIINTINKAVSYQTQVIEGIKDKLEDVNIKTNLHSQLYNNIARDIVVDVAIDWLRKICKYYRPDIAKVEYFSQDIEAGYYMGGPRGGITGRNGYTFQRLRVAIYKMFDTILEKWNKVGIQGFSKIESDILQMRIYKDIVTGTASLCRYDYEYYPAASEAFTWNAIQGGSLKFDTDKASYYENDTNKIRNWYYWYTIISTELDNAFGENNSYEEYERTSKIYDILFNGVKIEFDKLFTLSDMQIEELASAVYEE